MTSSYFFLNPKNPQKQPLVEKNHRFGSIWCADGFLLILLFLILCVFDTSPWQPFCHQLGSQKRVKDFGSFCDALNSKRQTYNHQVYDRFT